MLKNQTCNRSQTSDSIPKFQSFFHHSNKDEREKRIFYNNLLLLDGLGLLVVFISLFIFGWFIISLLNDFFTCLGV